MLCFPHSLALLLVTFGPDSGFAQRQCTSVDTEGFWKFNEVDGPILDAYDRSGNDCTSHRANNGFVGSWSGFDDTVDVLDRHGGGRVKFDGLSPNHIVMIGPDHHEDFNADSSSLLWRVKAKIEPDALSTTRWNPVIPGISCKRDGPINPVCGKCKSCPSQNHTGKAIPHVLWTNFC